MRNVEIKTLGTDNWRDTDFTDMQEAIQAVRDSYKVFGITNCQLRLKTGTGTIEWDNF